MMKTQIIITVVLFSIGFNTFAQSEVEKYGKDSLFIPFFEYVENLQYDSAIIYLDKITPKKHPIYYYKTALLYKIEMKIDSRNWDLSLVEDMGEMLNYWQGDSSNYLNMYGVVLRENDLNKKARKIFELGYEKYNDKILLQNILSLNNIEKKSKRNLEYEDLILKDSMVTGYYILGETYRQLDNPKNALYYFKLYESELRGRYINPKVYLDIIKLLYQTKSIINACEYSYLFTKHLENLSEYEKNSNKDLLDKYESEIISFKLECK